MNFKILHARAVETAKNYLKHESDLIRILKDIDECHGYREIGIKSLYEYARSLGLSESVAYNMMAVARKAKTFPALQEKIAAQEMSVSNAKMIVPVLTRENQTRWLEAASTLSKRELEREIAKEFPKQAVIEQAKHVTGDRMELKLGISEKLFEKLKRIQDLESKKEAASLEATLETMVDLYLYKNDPLEKAKRSKLVPGPVHAHSPRFVPAVFKHALQVRNQAKCSHPGCQERRWLDVHHIKPVALGGQTTLENLTLLCKGHHQMLHHRDLGQRP